jgi:hypothetical protein
VTSPLQLQPQLLLKLVLLVVLVVLFKISQLHQRAKGQSTSSQPKSRSLMLLLARGSHMPRCDRAARLPALAAQFGTILTVTAAVCKGSCSPGGELDGVSSAVLTACTQLCIADGKNEHQNPIRRPMQHLKRCCDCSIALSLAIVKMCMCVTVAASTCHMVSITNWLYCLARQTPSGD